MGGGGGKGGSSETTTRMPKSIEKAAEQNLKIADEVAKIGYTPYQGPTQAALTPAQKAAMQNTFGAASSFGMTTPQDMANPQTAGGGGGGGGRTSVDPFTGMAMDPTLTGGVLGYSPMGIYEGAKAKIPEAQRKMIDSFTMNPETGAAPTNPLIGPTAMFGGGQGGGQGGGGQGGQMGGQMGGMPFGGVGHGQGDSDSYSFNQWARNNGYSGGK